MQKFEEIEMDVGLQSLDLPTNYEENMTPELRQQIQFLVTKIDIRNRDFVTSYGAEQQAKLGKISDAMLLGEPMEETAELLNDLVNLIKNYDSGFDGEKRGLFRKIFSQSKNNVEQIRNNYQTVDKKIEEIVQELVRKKISLSKVFDDFGVLFKVNQETYEYLTVMIYAGEIVQKETEKKFDEMQKSANVNQQNIRDFENDINHFNERLHNLKLTRAIAIMLEPQIRIVQQNAECLEKSIVAAINTSISLWKTQMALALGIQTVRSALDFKDSVDDITNQVVLAISQAGKDLSIETVEANQRGVVDIEIVRQINQNLLQALTKTKESIEKRKKQTEKL